MIDLILYLWLMLDLKPMDVSFPLYIFRSTNKDIKLTMNPSCICVLVTAQFFITTVPCTWLDGKHTVFGRATSGFEVIHKIENVRVDKNDKPYDDIKIVSISIH